MLLVTGLLLAVVPMGVIGDDETSVRVIVLFKDKVDEKLIKGAGGKILEEYTLIPAVVTKLKQKDIDTLAEETGVKTVEKDATVSMEGTLDDEGKKTPAPTSPPSPGVQWGVDRIDAEKAWSASTGASIRVAVLDTGIDTDHPELMGVYAGGYDFINIDDDPEDDNGHGTHCAGIIAAAKDATEAGVVGVAYDVDLFAVKVLNSQGSGSYSQVISGIQWAITNDMDVISMSLSGSSGSDSLKAACDNAKTAGVIIVAAAGNSGKKNTALDTVQYPAHYDSVIAVGATDSSDKRASWSSTGSALDVVAPGVGIWSTYNDGKYRSFSGTSMACPHVAGTVALMLATDPGGWTWDEVYSTLTVTADDLGASGYDNVYGKGIVDAQEAVTGTAS